MVVSANWIISLAFHRRWGNPTSLWPAYHGGQASGPGTAEASKPLPVEDTHHKKCCLVASLSPSYSSFVSSLGWVLHISRDWSSLLPFPQPSLLSSLPLPSYFLTSLSPLLPISLFLPLPPSLPHISHFSLPPPSLLTSLTLKWAWHLRILHPTQGERVGAQGERVGASRGRGWERQEGERDECNDGTGLTN